MKLIQEYKLRDPECVTWCNDEQNDVAWEESERRLKSDCDYKNATLYIIGIHIAMVSQRTAWCSMRKESERRLESDCDYENATLYKMGIHIAMVRQSNRNIER